MHTEAGHGAESQSKGAEEGEGEVANEGRSGQRELLREREMAGRQDSVGAERAAKLGRRQGRDIEAQLPHQRALLAWRVCFAAVQDGDAAPFSSCRGHLRR